VSLEVWKVSSMYDSMKFCPTGLPSLDAMLGGGIGKSQFTHISSCEGLGRTTLAVQLAASMVTSGHKTLFATTRPYNEVMSETNLSQEHELFAYITIFMQSQYESVANTIEYADYIVIDGPKLNHGPKELVKNPYQLTIWDQEMLMGMAKIASAAHKHHKPMVICSNDSRFLGPGPSNPGIPSKALQEIHGFGSTLIMMMDSNRDYCDDTGFAQHLIIKRLDQTAICYGNLVTLEYQNNPHRFVDNRVQGNLVD